MIHQTSLSGNRIQLMQLLPADDAFMLELMNTPGWLRFIGDRNIRTLSDAHKYIENVLSDKEILIWKIKHLESNTLLGIVTFIKRNYLDYPDIGFALLPGYCGQGFAFEASQILLTYIRNTHSTTKVLATTLADNASSVKLLIKLGMQFEKSINVNTETLQVYSLLLT